MSLCASFSVALGLRGRDWSGGSFKVSEGLQVNDCEEGFGAEESNRIRDYDTDKK